MAFDSTVGGENANSYTTVAFADTYLLEERLGASDWEDLTMANKQAALMSATRVLEIKHYQGYKTDNEQALKFPRTGIADEDGDLYDPGTIPDRVQQACCELAFALSQNPDLLTSDGISRYKSIASEGDKFEFNTERSNSMPPIIDTLLSDFVASMQARTIRA
jgi:hypothetical protein